MREFDLGRSKVKPDGFYDIPPSLIFGVACGGATGKFGADRRKAARNRVKRQDNAELHGSSIGLLPFIQLR
jgi:hypothetical protein